MDLAASMYSLFITARIGARTTLANAGTAVIPTASIQLNTPLPRIAASAIARTRLGIALNTSSTVSYTHLAIPMAGSPNFPKISK